MSNLEAAHLRIHFSVRNTRNLRQQKYTPAAHSRTGMMQVVSPGWASNSFIIFLCASKMR
jgi:hypothetical protein